MKMRLIRVFLVSLSSLTSLFPLSTTLAAPQAMQLASVPNKVEFLAVGRPGLIKIRGSAEAQLTGKASLDSEKQRLSGEFRIPLSTLDTGIQKRDDHMKERYLEVAKHPEATLKLSDAPLKGAFTGELTLHGVTKPVSGSLSIEGDSGRAEFKLRLQDFGIAIPSFAGITVADEVSVQVTARMEPAK